MPFSARQEHVDGLKRSHTAFPERFLLGIFLRAFLGFEQRDIFASAIFLQNYFLKIKNKIKSREKHVHICTG